MATSAQAGGAGAFRPGESVQQLRLAGLLEGPSLGAQYEPARELPRQCRGGEFLSAAEAGAHKAENLSRPGRIPP